MDGLFDFRMKTNNRKFTAVMFFSFSLEDSEAEANWQRYLVKPKKISHLALAPLLFGIVALNLSHLIICSTLKPFET